MNFPRPFFCGTWQGLQNGGIFLRQDKSSIYIYCIYLGEVNNEMIMNNWAGFDIIQFEFTKFNHAKR